MQTIGERLEEARKKKGISIREAAEATKIRGDYLQKFESNQFDIGLTEIYTRGFLRTYSNYLKVPADRLLNDYTALGRGESRPRAPSREVYGRMDISVASANEASDRAAPPGQEPAAEPSHNQPRYPRSSSNLPQGPAIDPATLFKYAKWTGVALVALLLILLVKSFFTKKDSGNSVHNAPASAQTNTDKKVVVISALGSVRVQVWEKLPNARAEESYGAVLVAEKSLARGETVSFTKTGPVYIRASAQENIQIDVAGKRILPSAYGYKGDLPIALE
jgi:transcriptional regulator with XRE-family HTH domain